MRAMRKKLETKHTHASPADLLHIRIGNLDWCKCEHFKNEPREIDCLFCREVDAMLIGLAKIPEREGRISLWATARLLVTRATLTYPADEFLFLFLVNLNEMKRLGES